MKISTFALPPRSMAALRSAEEKKREYPQLTGSSALFLAHAESEKRFVEQVKDSIISLSRSGRIRRAGLLRGEPLRALPIVYYDKDDFSPSRDQSLREFTRAAAEADALLLFVPAGGFQSHSFAGKELLAFTTGIIHSTRVEPDPTSLTDHQNLRARQRIQKVLVVDRHGETNWVDGLPPRQLPRICREGVLRGLFGSELPRLREQSSTAEDVAAAALARLWNVPPVSIQSRVAARRRRNAAMATIAAAAMAVVAMLAIFQYWQAERQRRQARGNELAALSESTLEADRSLAALLAIESFHRLADDSLNTLRADQAVRDNAARVGGIALAAGSRFPEVTFSSDGRWLLLVTDSTTLPEPRELKSQQEASLHEFLPHDPRPKVRARWQVYNPVRAANFVGDRKLFFRTDGQGLLVTTVPGNPVSQLMMVPPARGPELGNGAIDSRGQFVLSVGSSASNDPAWRIPSPNESLELLEAHDHGWARRGSLLGHSAPIHAVAFQDAGELAASGDTTGIVILWERDGAGLSQLRSFRFEDAFPERAISQLHFLPGGRWLTAAADTAFSQGRVAVYDLYQDAPTPTLSIGGTLGRIRMVVCPNSQWLLAFGSGGADSESTGAALIELPATGTPHAWPLTISSGIRDGAFSADCTTATFASGAGLVEFRLEASKEPVRTDGVLGFREPITRLAFSPDGRCLAAGGARNLYLVHSLDPGGQAQDSKPLPIVTLQGHASEITALTISPDGNKLVSASEDVVRLWDLRNPQPNADPILIPDHPGALTRRELQTADPLVLAADVHTKPRTNTVFEHERHSPEDALRDCGMTAFGDSTRKALSRFGDDAKVTVAHSASCRWLVFGEAEASSPFLYDLRNPAPEAIELTGHLPGPNSSWHFEFGPKEGLLATAHRDESDVNLWNLKALEAGASRLDGNGTLSGMRFSLDETGLLVVGDSAQLWRLWPRPEVAVELPLGQFNSQYSGALWTGNQRYVIASEGWSARDDAPKEMYTFAWLAATPDVIGVLGSAVARNFTLKEWRKYFPGEPYQKTIAEQPVAEDAFADALRTADDAVRKHARTDAIESYRRAIEWAVAEADARRCNEVAWAASLNGFAPMVREASAQAVRIAPWNANYWDTNGLVLAMTGSYVEAIAAFNKTLDLALIQGYSSEFVTKRTEWLSILKKGSNPFGPQEVTALRGR